MKRKPRIHPAIQILEWLNAQQHRSNATTARIDEAISELKEAEKLFRKIPFKKWKELTEE